MCVHVEQLREAKSTEGTRDSDNGGLEFKNLRGANGASGRRAAGGARQSAGGH